MKNSVRTSRSVAKMASTLMRTSTSKKIRSVAAGGLVNRKRTSKR